MKNFLNQHTSTIILNMIFLSFIISVTINPLLSRNFDKSYEYPNNDNVLFSIDTYTIYCKALSHIESNDIFYKPVISKLPCSSKTYAEILCREDKKFNKKDYIILSCVPNTTFAIEVLDPNTKDFSTCNTTKSYMMVQPNHKIPSRSIKCSHINGLKNDTYYLDDAFYINRVRDY